MTVAPTYYYTRGHVEGIDGMRKNQGPMITSLKWQESRLLHRCTGSRPADLESDMSDGNVWVAINHSRQCFEARLAVRMV